MAVTTFSHFSAASELIVTAGVFYFFWQAIRHDNFRWKFIGILLVFETVVNVAYMVGRMAQSAPPTERPGWATALLAGHGLLSLLMFIGLIAFVLIAYRYHRVEKVNYFQSRLAQTWVFLVFWSLSVLSGEAIYVLQLTDSMTV